MPFPNTILVVEHDPAIRELLIAIFTDEGYRTASASTGLSGLAALTRDQPALTLFDMSPPDLSAGELIDELQAMALTGARLAVMGTTHRGKLPMQIPETLAYLEKPFDLDVLLRLVAQYVKPQTRMNGFASEADCN